MIHGAFSAPPEPPPPRTVVARTFRPGGDWGAFVRAAEQAGAGAAPGLIGRDTPLVPRVVAAEVLAEAEAWLEASLPPEWLAWLVFHAETVYRHNVRFRRRLREPGNRGRDWLWAFMRHWLAGLVGAYDMALFRRLPDGYGIGRPPPGRPGGTDQRAG